MARICRGRRKIEMAKIKNELNLRVTFSKRKSGVFKKANELSVLCGAEVALIIPSPGNKVYSYGNPTVESILDRYMKNNPPTSGGFSHVMEAQSNENLKMVTNELNQLENNLEMEHTKQQTLEGFRKSSMEANQWWKAPTDELNLHQLEHLMIAMNKLKGKVDENLQNHKTHTAINDAYCN